MGPRRWLWSLAAAFAAVAGLTLLLRGGRWVVAHLGGGTGAAQWIWVAHDRRQTQPLAFYAARDFTLASPPPARARLLALGDPEYVLYLNGKRVGAGGWRPGARLDEYEVGPLLRPGGNRLLAELRSADGAGGFLASLVEAASGRALVGTDGAWRIFPRHRLGLLRGWLPADPASAAMLASAAGPGEAAICWGRPPVGRWGRVLPAAPRPVFAELTGGRRLPRRPTSRRRRPASRATARWNCSIGDARSPATWLLSRASRRAWTPTWWRRRRPASARRCCGPATRRRNPPAPAARPRARWW